MGGVRGDERACVAEAAPGAAQAVAAGARAEHGGGWRDAKLLGFLGGTKAAVTTGAYTQEASPLQRHCDFRAKSDFFRFDDADPFFFPFFFPLFFGYFSFDLINFMLYPLILYLLLGSKVLGFRV